MGTRRQTMRRKKDKLELGLHPDSGSDVLDDQYGGNFGGASDPMLQCVEKRMMAEADAHASGSSALAQEPSASPPLKALIPPKLAHRIAAMQRNESGAYSSSAIMSILAGPPTPQEQALRQEERTWERARRRMHNDGSAAWARWCGRQV